MTTEDITPSETPPKGRVYGFRSTDAGTPYLLIDGEPAPLDEEVPLRAGEVAQLLKAYMEEGFRQGQAAILDVGTGITLLHKPIIRRMA